MDRLRVVDLLLRNYHDPQRVFSMPYKDGMALVDNLMERERKEYYYRQWLAYLPHMDKTNYVSFAEYYDSYTTPSVDMRPKSVIMGELKKLGVL